MGELVNKGIAKNETASTRLFDSLIADETFMTVTYESPQEYVYKYWQALENANQPSLHGNVFEFIIYSLLYRENIRPFYTQAKVAFVPNVNFDALLYNQSAPISLSLKTSLRERYKQADLEAIALKYVHRRAKSYLLTLESDEAQKCKERVKMGEIIGLDGIIDCNTTEINDLISELHKIKKEFTESKTVEVVTGILIK